MNVVAKSTNLSPLLKATSNAVSNGIRPVAGTGNVIKPHLLVIPAVNRKVSQSMSESLFSGPVRVSSGVTGSTQVSQKRLAHTDIQWPDFTTYRRDGVKSPTANNREDGSNRKTYSYLVTAGTAVSVVYGAKSLVHMMVGSLSASADVLALAKIEVKLDSIPEGKSVIFKWRGKPLFIRHRPESEIQKEQAVDISTLRDPQTDQERVKQPNWLIVIGVCTHLGCVPIANAGDFGGYYCPCHGSHYDASGRIRKGPAPLNLEVPYYEFQENNMLVVG